MAADFRPLLETIGAKNPHAAAAAFSPMPAPSPSPTAIPSKPAPVAVCGEVKVELKRDGDRVTEIRVHCRCGEIIELACDY